MDKLEILDGVGPATAKVLAAAGLGTFAAIAALTPTELAGRLGDRAKRLSPADFGRIVSSAAAAEKDRLAAAEQHTAAAAAPAAAAQPPAPEAPEGNAAQATPPPVNLLNLQSHPLALRFSELMAELEKLPADPRQTAIVVKLGHLRQEAQDLINRVSAPPASLPELMQQLTDAETRPDKDRVRLRVTGPKAGRWRAGLHFGPEPTVIEVPQEAAAAILADSALAAAALD